MCIQLSSDALEFAGSAHFREAMAGFIAEWPGIGSSGAIKAYIDTNPYGTGVEGDKLDFAAGPEKYHSVHKQHHAYFRELAASKGYFDFLLIDMQGTIMYSISKGPEYGTNLRTGPYKSTGLAKAFSLATQNPDVVTETDKLNEDLKDQCRGGKVQGILTKDEVTNYFLGFVMKRSVSANGYCNKA
jgi:hypothetical protein